MEILMKKFVVSLVALLILVACASGNSASITGTWSLVSYGLASEQKPAAADVDTSIEFKDGQMTGNVGCNGFGGKYEVDGDKITFSEVMSTLMFCEGPVGDQELGTLAVLRESATYALDGDTLTITSADDNSMVVLARK
jgi:heat shock protein HslJ